MRGRARTRVRSVIEWRAAPAGTRDAPPTDMTITSTIRIGTADDLPAVQQLIDAGHRAEIPSASMLSTVMGKRYLLVLDAPDGGLAAAAHISIDGVLAHLDLLAVAPEFHDEHLESRMVGVAEALSAAFGCKALDVTAHSRAA
jgi:N-acetylglutamate synthase-like GNAT family acetyltransferase